MKAIYFPLLAALLAFVSCTKEKETIQEDEPNPDISEIPFIELLSVSATTVVQFQDPLIITIEYTDGDGDLGTEDPDAYSIEVVDQRNPAQLIFLYHLSPRAPIDAEVPIQGTLDVVLPNTILLNDAADSETTTFTIRLLDRAGNWSNVVETGAITVVK